MHHFTSLSSLLALLLCGALAAACSDDEAALGSDEGSVMDPDAAVASPPVDGGGGGDDGERDAPGPDGGGAGGEAGQPGHVDAPSVDAGSAEGGAVDAGVDAEVLDGGDAGRDAGGGSDPRCGDGVVDEGEACDDGGDNSDDAADACRSDCTAAHCGDGVLDDGELCDEGAGNSDRVADACRTDCVPARCGDDVHDTDEACDFGADNSDSTPNFCRSDCSLPRCGDAVVDAGEECDDGNAVDDDGCSACAIDPPMIPVGDVCSDPIAVTLPFALSQDTAGASDDYSSASCGPLADGSGAGGADQVYAFTPPHTGLFELRVTPAAGFDAAVYVTADCSDIGSGCDLGLDAQGAGAIEEASMALVAGEPRYLVVDGVASSQGGYDIVLSQAPIDCESYCAQLQRACSGDDAQYDGQQACLDYCGDWAGMVAGSVGDSAADTIACRIHHAVLAERGDATVHCAHAGPTGGGVCGSRCDVYCGLMARNCAGSYDDAAACQSACAGFDDAAGAEAGDGDNLQCRIAQAALAGSDVDAGSAAAHCPNAGASPVAVCTDVASGDSCDDPFPIAALPFVVDGDSTDAGSDHGPGACGGNGAGNPDQVYAFAPPADTQVVVDLTLISGPTLVYIASDCGDVGGSCFWAHDFFGGPHPTPVTLRAGTTYYFVVDGYFATEAGPYRLSVTEHVPTTGDRCDDPFVYDGSPQDSSAAGADHDSLGCPGGGLPDGDNPDQVHRFTASVSGTHQVTLDASSSPAPTLLWITTDPECDASGCIFAHDYYGAHGQPQDVELVAGTDYYVIVGAFTVGEAGPYTLTITEP